MPPAALPLAGRPRRLLLVPRSRDPFTRKLDNVFPARLRWPGRSRRGKPRAAPSNLCHRRRPRTRVTPPTAAPASLARDKKVNSWKISERPRRLPALSGRARSVWAACRGPARCRYQGAGREPGFVTAVVTHRCWGLSCPRKQLFHSRADRPRFQCCRGRPAYMTTASHCRQSTIRLAKLPFSTTF